MDVSMGLKEGNTVADIVVAELRQEKEVSARLREILKAAVCDYEQRANLGELAIVPSWVTLARQALPK